MDRVAAFALLLFLVQSLEGTALYFSIGTLTFLIVAALAFNAAGGLTRASGAYILTYSMLDFIIGVCYKAFLGEPGESNLVDPKTTIAVFAGGITAMFISVLVSRQLSRRTGLLENMLRSDRMYRSCVGCIVFALSAPFLIGMLGPASARLESAFTQLNELLPLAIIIGTMYEVRRSGGRRSINIPVVFAMVYSFLIFGILGFSKQGMLVPLYCWAVAACASRYRITTLQMMSLLLWVVFVFKFLVPYSQYGRRFVEPDFSTSQRIVLAQRLLSQPGEVVKNYQESEEENPSAVRYYNKGEGFWDRLNFVAVDDSLINVTDNGHVFGYLPITASFVNAIPHVFYPNKPVYNFGNMFAHEIGGLPDEDTTTGISFSPTSELYHLGGWFALFLVGPLVWILQFVVLDSLCGDLRKTPWGLLTLAMLSHSAPETGVEGCIYMTTFGVEILTFCAIFSTYVAPVVSTVVLGESTPVFVPLKTRFRSPESALGGSSRESTI